MTQPAKNNEADHQWLSEIRNLVNLDKADKSSEKLSRLETLLKRHKFLRSLQEDDPLEFRKLLMNAKLIEYTSKEVITPINSYAEQLFAVLSGQVDMSVRSMKKESTLPTQQLSSTSSAHSLSVSHLSQSISSSSASPSLQQSSLLHVRTLSCGDGFNEISILTKSRSMAQYTASSTTSTQNPVILLYFEKQDTAKIVSVINVIVDMHVQYLKNLPLFWNTSTRHLQLVYLLQANKSIMRDASLFLEGEPASFVYIIKQGEFAYYKYFQDLQQRKSKDSQSTFAIERMTGSLLKLNSFQKNKNIRIRQFTENEIIGEEDVIGRTNRSFSVLCESEFAEVLCFSATAFKSIILNLENVATFVLTKLRSKQEDITRILDEQAVQVSSARINILERDITRVALTQDFVKSRSLFAVTGGSTLPVTASSKGLRQSRDSVAYQSNYRSNFSPVNPLAKNTTNTTNSFQQQSNTYSRSQLHQKHHSMSNVLNSTQQQRYQTNNNPQLNSLLQNPMIFELNQSTLSTTSQINQELSSTPSRPLLYQTGSVSVQRLPLARIPSLPTESVLIDENNNKNNNQTQSEQQQQVPSAQSQPTGEEQINSKSTLGGATPATKRDSQQFFDNFTRNSFLYMQKFQNNSNFHNAALPPGSNLHNSNMSNLQAQQNRRKKNNDEELDMKGRLLSQLIQDEINKANANSATADIPEITTPSSRQMKLPQEGQAIPRASSSDITTNLNGFQPKIIYRKPLTDADYSRIKEQNERESEKLKSLSQTPIIRSYKINFYQSKK